MTPNQLAHKFRLIAIALQKVPAKVLKDVGNATVSQAREWSSGPYSLVDLAKLGHPYALRHIAFGKKRNPGAPAIPIADYEVNEQKGIFKASWKYVVGSNVTSRSVQGIVENNAAWAGWVDRGTQRMIARNISVKLTAHVEAVLPIEARNSVEHEIRSRLVG